jgi:flagella basal body P-ring formation protein FlgA
MALAAVLGLAVLVPAQAQAVGSEAEVPALVRAWVQQQLARGAPQPTLRLTASVGAVDARLRLAPCERAEVYLPAGARLWGSVRAGVRCLQGATRWSVFVPVTVQAHGPAWVLSRPVAAGATLTEDDVQLAEVDWAADASPVLATREAWLGQVATRAWPAGAALRQHMVRAPQVFAAGAPVRVLVQGGGFQISAEAQALSAGQIGQPARVRMDNGRILSGVVLDGRTVRVDI